VGVSAAAVEIAEICEKTAKYEESQKIRQLRKNTCAGDKASIDVYSLKYASYQLRSNPTLSASTPSIGLNPCITSMMSHLTF
jgi:hypothetical protein